MGKAIDFIKKVSKDLHIEKDERETESEWVTRVAYSASIQSAVASLCDTTDAGECCNYASCQIGNVRFLRGDNPLRLTPMSGGGQYVKDIVNSGTYSSAEEMFCLYGINGTNGEDITVKKSDSLVYVSVPKTDTQTRNIFTLYSWATSDSKIRAISVDAWPAIESILCDDGYHISHILD